MRRRVNKLGKGLAALSLLGVMTLVGVNAPTVSAATYNEVEPNDVRSEATEIKAGNQYIGKISDKNPEYTLSGEKDFYKYTVAQDGYFNFTFSKASQDTENVGSGWNISIYSESTCLYSANVKTDTVTTPNFNYKKGSTIYILVEEKSNFYTNCPTDIPYKLQVNAYPNSFWEQESNDTKTEATVIKSNTTYYGNLTEKDNEATSAGEEDYYKYTVQENGYFTFSFGKASIDQDDVKSGWIVELYNDTQLLYSMNVKADQTVTPKLNLKKGSIVYIKVRPANTFYMYSSVYIDYKLRLDFVKNEYWEVEANDTKTTATKINVGKVYYGNLLDKNESSTYSGEDDYYEYVVAQDGKYTLDFSKVSINDEKIGSGWSASIYNGNTLVQKMEIKEKGVTSSQFTAKRGDRIYILVNANNTFYMYCPTNIDYQLKLNCVAQPYAIKYSLNGGKNNAGNPARYYSNTNVVLKNATRKGYTFEGWYIGTKKVTQITKGSKGAITLTAKWKKVSVGSPSKLSAASKKSKTLAVSFSKVKNAAGYELSYSTNSKFKSGTVTKYVKTTNATIKKLNSKKKYYVRVRAYRLDSTGNKVFGKYKTIKAVKIK